MIVDWRHRICSVDDCGTCVVDGQGWPCDAEQQRIRADKAVATVYERDQEMHRLLTRLSDTRRWPTKCVCGDYTPDSSGDAACSNCGADYAPGDPAYDDRLDDFAREDARPA